MGYAETRAALARLAVGVEGVAGPREVWRLAEWLGPAVEIRHQIGAGGSCRPRSDGGARITLPANADDEQHAAVLLEEIGHYLCRAGLRWPIWGGPALDLFREWDDEGEAARFAAEFRAPAGALLQLRHDWELWDLCEATTLDQETVRDQLRRGRATGPLRLPEPPSWSAWRHYRCRYVGGGCPHLRLDGPGGPWTWPASAAGLSDQVRRLHLDLAALRPEELALRFRSEHVEQESVVLAWSDVAPGLARELSRNPLQLS